MKSPRFEPLRAAKGKDQEEEWWSTCGRDKPVCIWHLNSCSRQGSVSRHLAPCFLDDKIWGGRWLSVRLPNGPPSPLVCDSHDECALFVHLLAQPCRLASAQPSGAAPRLSRVQPILFGVEPPRYSSRPLRKIPGTPRLPPGLTPESSGCVVWRSFAGFLRPGLRPSCSLSLQNEAMAIERPTGASPIGNWWETAGSRLARPQVRLHLRSRPRRFTPGHGYCTSATPTSRLW